MDRTVMPFSHVLETGLGKWADFRKELSTEDREAFDRLFDRAKFHTAAGVYMSNPYLLETILLSICLELERLIGEIQRIPKEKGIVSPVTLIHHAMEPYWQDGFTNESSASPCSTHSP
jgi:hypothetical protein